MSNQTVQIVSVLYPGVGNMLKEINIKTTISERVEAKKLCYDTTSIIYSEVRK